MVTQAAMASQTPGTSALPLKASGTSSNPGAALVSELGTSRTAGTWIGANGRPVVVTINDRGPFVGGRIIDLSRGAAQAISMTGAGVAPVLRIRSLPVRAGFRFLRS